MGLNIPPPNQIAGYPSGVFKRTLAQFFGGQPLAVAFESNAILDSCVDAAIVIAECHDRGLLSEVSNRITEAGKAVAAAHLLKRAKLAAAEQTLKGLLDAVKAINSDPNGVDFVDEVWLSGSLMRRQLDIGDIALAIESSRRPPYAHFHQTAERRAKALLRARFPQTPFPQWWEETAEERLLARLLFGEHRHPLLSGARLHTGVLIQTAEPCQLIYDRARRGRVYDPVLPHHPNADPAKQGRDAPLKAPQLGAAPLRPMNGRWLSRYASRGVIVQSHLEQPFSPVALPMTRCDAHLHGAKIVVGENRHILKNLALQAFELDGRALVGVSFDEIAEFAIRRDIALVDQTWTLNASIPAFWTPSDAALEPEQLNTAARIVAALLAGDATRIARRLADQPTRHIRVAWQKPTSAALPPGLSDTIVASSRNALTVLQNSDFVRAHAIVVQTNLSQ
jgi:hypothetical protein